MSSTFSLVGKRIKLRLIEKRDALALFELYSDLEVMRYWNHAPWTNIGQARMAIDEAQTDFDTGASLHCAIEHRATGVLIGSCALYAFVTQDRRASVGYLLSKAYWGQGYLSEAMRVLLEYAFSELKLNRVEADVNRHNTGSAMALERLGFCRDGYTRKHWIVGDKKHDTQSYGLLRQEWIEAVTAMAK